MAGSLSLLDVFASIYNSDSRSGRCRAGNTIDELLSPEHYHSLQIDFGIGSAGSDFWTISSYPVDGLQLPFNVPAFLFEFQNLGGVTTGVDYPLMSFMVAASAPPEVMFGFAPDMAAAGWAGTFTTTPTGVSVRFSSVPEPSTCLLAAFGLVSLTAWGWRRSRSSGV